MSILDMKLAEEDQNTEFTATYSAEDNKLRIYADKRLSLELYRELRDSGFSWAPKQELFVAHKWTPKREDICIFLAGDIGAEESTLAERAEAKANRLDGYRVSRTRDANAYQSRANQIGERFAQGQPILVGHHSERKARSDQNKMHNAMDTAVKHMRTADYWASRAEGVERHAEFKNNSRTRANRIKTLLKDLRDHQRAINHHEKVAALWEDIKTIKESPEKNANIERHAFGYTEFGSSGYNSAKEDLESGKITHAGIVDRCIELHTKAMNHPYRARWIEHILNRLGYETELLGAVALFDAENLTPVVLQKFARVHGADSPKAKKSGDEFTLSSPWSLPLHIAEGKELTLSAAEWCQLMQDCGYSVAANTPRKTARTTTPLLNIDAEELHKKHNYDRSKTQAFKVEKMTREQYKKIRDENKETVISACGLFRFRTAFINENSGRGAFSGYRAAIYLTDSKTHPMPEAADA